MYCKRILILQQSDKRFAERNKELCGMVKLINNSQEQTDVTVFVTNADTYALGEWWLLLAFGSSKFAQKLSGLNNDYFSLPYNSLDNVSCLLVKREDVCMEAARSYVGEVSQCDVLRRQMESIVRATVSNLADDAPTAYEQFVACASDYYQGLDVSKLKKDAAERYKSVDEYSTAFERYYATGANTDYYESVKSEITKVFVKFPPYYPLIRKYKESFFVRIDFPASDKYFVLGVLQQNGKIRYICYGLPANGEGFKDKDFVYVDSEPVSFWMLFQDANTGQITAM